ncbi:hypothetical protein QQ054_21525 [Oscillatoria amoena NRMC-F 0135]|nr:hypothetical protein [Oscillatoria amoena NRMC-F 0135]
MKKWVILIWIVAGNAIGSLSQIRTEKLVIKPKEVFKLESQSDILVADTLVMMDSSTILLNPLRAENYIRAKVIIAGRATSIMGNGANGANGRNGRPGTVAAGPCKNGSDGSAGTPGLTGVNGINLFLYFDRLVVNGQLTIILTGGRGGNGGTGGVGGDGSSGTVHCSGGNGGNGGNGGRGGDGGNGGNLLIQSSQALTVKEWAGTKLIVKNYAGTPGLGGKRGNPGSAGLGPSRRNGKDGIPGIEGAAGIRGKDGLVTFQTN